DLTAIGVTKPGHRKKITSEISKLNVQDWLPDYRPAGLGEWLALIGLAQYHATLVENGYEKLEFVSEITWEDLHEIGITKLGHQKKLMLAVRRLSELQRFEEQHQARLEGAAAASGTLKRRPGPASPASTTTMAIVSHGPPGDPPGSPASCRSPKLSTFQDSELSPELQAAMSGVACLATLSPGVTRDSAGLVARAIRYGGDISASQESLGGRSGGSGNSQPTAVVLACSRASSSSQESVGGGGGGLQARSGSGPILNAGGGEGSGVFPPEQRSSGAAAGPAVQPKPRPPLAQQWSLPSQPSPTFSTFTPPHTPTKAPLASPCGAAGFPLPPPPDAGDGAVNRSHSFAVRQRKRGPPPPPPKRSSSTIASGSTLADTQDPEAGGEEWRLQRRRRWEEDVVPPASVRRDTLEKSTDWNGNTLSEAGGGPPSVRSIAAMLEKSALGGLVPACSLESPSPGETCKPRAALPQADADSDRAAHGDTPTPGVDEALSAHIVGKDATDKRSRGSSAESIPFAEEGNQTIKQRPKNGWSPTRGEALDYEGNVVEREALGPTHGDGSRNVDNAAFLAPVEDPSAFEPGAGRPGDQPHKGGHGQAKAQPSGEYGGHPPPSPPPPPPPYRGAEAARLPAGTGDRAKPTVSPKPSATSFGQARPPGPPPPLMKKPSMHSSTGKDGSRDYPPGSLPPPPPPPPMSVKTGAAASPSEQDVVFKRNAGRPHKKPPLPAHLFSSEPSNDSSSSSSNRRSVPHSPGRMDDRERPPESPGGGGEAATAAAGDGGRPESRSGLAEVAQHRLEETSASLAAALQAVEDTLRHDGRDDGKPRPTGNLLDDIGSMFDDLADQLDAMLD
uniref:SAM domain-containing protein n=1 Tax=Petromyzon marinus TaxID=7757 RepID=S4RIC6_PETMA